MNHDPEDVPEPEELEPEPGPSVEMWTYHALRAILSGAPLPVGEVDQGGAEKKLSFAMMVFYL